MVKSQLSYIPVCGLFTTRTETAVSCVQGWMVHWIYALLNPFHKQFELLHAAAPDENHRWWNRSFLLFLQRSIMGPILNKMIIHALLPTDYFILCSHICLDLPNASIIIVFRPKFCMHVSTRQCAHLIHRGFITLKYLLTSTNYKTSLWTITVRLEALLCTTSTHMFAVWHP
jgi:hypothetical protein